MTMRYKLLGRSGLRVSELALGTMTFGETWGWGASKEESRRFWLRPAGNSAGGFARPDISTWSGTVLKR